MKKDPMAEQLKTELRELKTTQRGVRRDLATAEKKFRAAKAEFGTVKRNCASALKRLDRRASILNGRLAA